MTIDKLAKDLGLMSHRDVVSAGAAENVRWTVEGFMRAGGYAMLSGASKAGKTAIATHLAYCVATGRPFIGLPTPQAPVLWLAFEESVEERAYLCERYPDAPIYTVDSPGKVDTPEGIESIRRQLACVEELTGSKVGLVVVDTLTPAVVAENLSEAVNARRAVTPLNNLRRELGVSVLLIHHHRKNGGAKGDQDKIADSHQLQAAVGQWWTLEVRRGSPRTITLCGKGRGSWANRDWTVHSTDEWSFELIEGEAPTKDDRSPKERFLDVLQASDKPMTSAKVASAIKMDREYAKNVAKQLLDAGKVKKAGKAGRFDLWASVA